jgi:hypothetical protein
MSKNNQGEITTFLASLRSGLWFLCLPAWMFGTVERSISSLADGFLSALDITQVFTAFVFLIFWLFLKPISNFN